MFGMAAAAALADGVNSANTVGYYDFGGFGNFNLTAITFEPVGGETFTLGQLKVNDKFDCTSDFISIWNGGTKLFETSYLGAEDAAAEGVPEGWYPRAAFNDWVFNAADCKNSTTLEKGRGIVFHRGTFGAAIRYSGQVQSADESFGGFGNFNITANTTAKSITLSEIKVNDKFDCTSDFISIWNGGTKQYEASYLGADDAAAEGVPEGWYPRAAFNDSVFNAADCKNAEVLPPGKGFVFHRGTTGAAVILPNPQE